MGMWEQLHGRTTTTAIIRGIGLAAVLVAINGLAAFNFIPSSYQQFSWEAYAITVYTNTPTPTPTSTPTGTPSNTPTSTPTNTPTVTNTPVVTPVPDGGDCTTPSQCQSGFCVDGTCCNTICDLPGQTCEDGTCNSAAAAPALSYRSLALVVVLLAAIGFFALTPLRFGKRR